MKDKIISVLPVAALVLIIAASGILMFNVSRQESAIMDELAHIPAGYSYAKYLDYRLNPEHPPLLKALAGLPLTFANLSFPLNNENWTTKLNAQWDMGSLFLYHSGNNADQIVETARIFPIILTLLTILLIFIWSRELLGNWWALLPAFLFGISPTVLAQGHYVTTDLAATFGFLLSTYLFVKYLNNRNRKNQIFAGVGLGIALLLKFSTVLLVPILGLILFFFWLGETIRKSANARAIGTKYGFWHSISQGFKYLWELILIFLIAGVVVYAVYFIFTLNYPPERQLSDTTQILQGFQPQWLGNLNISLVKNSFTRPIAQYSLGILMVLQRSSGGNTSYFLGHVSNSGWWYYFPVIFLLKESLPALVLLLVGLLFGLRKTFAKIFNGGLFKNFSDYLGTNLAEFGMLTVVIVYWAYSIKSPLNIGFRHILPTIPFMYMLAGSALKNWPACSGKFTEKTQKIFKYGFISIALIFTAWETFAAYPYFLSYFNEIGGGTMNGYKYVEDSNYDWGQDLKRLQTFVKDNGIEKIAVDYFGGGDIKYYLGDAAEEWHSNSGNPIDKNIEWLAISAEFLQNSVQPADDSVGRKPDETYGWLQALRPAAPGMGNVPTPDYRVGTSIFVYHL